MSAPSTSISTRLERLPFSRFHLTLLVMGGLGYLFDAMDSAMVGFVLPSLKAQWQLDSARIGLLAAGGATGGIVGAALAGWLGDRFGRRHVMMWALGLYCLASIGSATASSWQQFYAWRVLAGIGTTAESVIIAPFLAEFAPRQWRGRFTGALASCFSFGYVSAAILGVSIVPLHPDAWRVALVLTAAPILMLLWWRRALPESPRWLEARGRHEEAHRVASDIERRVQLSQQGRAREFEQSPISNIEATPQYQHAAPEVRTGSILAAYGQLWSRPLRRRTAVAWMAWFSIGFSYYAFFTWLPTLLIESGMTLTRSFSFSLAIYAAQIPGYFSAAYLNDVLGRRTVIASYMLLGAVSAIFFAFASSDLRLILSGMSLSLFMNGVYAGLYSYTPEIFPTHVRAMGQGASTAISRIGAMLAPITVGLVFPLYGFPGVFGLTTALLTAGAICVACLGISTRGRALEDIAADNPSLIPKTSTE